MRNKTFISSMVGIAAAVAVAGSANASVTLDFATVATPTPFGAGYYGGVQDGYGGFNWDEPTTNPGVMTQLAFSSSYGSASGIAGQVLFNGGVASTTASWLGLGGPTISLEQMVVGRIWSNVGAASTQLTITGYKASVLVGTQVVNQTGSNQTVTFSGGFGDIDKFVITTTAGGDYWFGGEIQFSVVPAPGALALLGVAGLVGARRRRA